MLAARGARRITSQLASLRRNATVDATRTSVRPTVGTGVDPSTPSVVVAPVPLSSAATQSSPRLMPPTPPIRLASNQFARSTGDAEPIRWAKLPLALGSALAIFLVAAMLFGTVETGGAPLTVVRRALTSDTTDDARR